MTLRQRVNALPVGAILAAGTTLKVLALSWRAPWPWLGFVTLITVLELWFRRLPAPTDPDPWALVKTMPSTNVRIACTLLMALGTGAKVIALDWTPPMEWLGFLTIWAGLDVAQFHSKRVTNKDGSGETSI